LLDEHQLLHDINCKKIKELFPNNIVSSAVENMDLVKITLEHSEIYMIYSFNELRDLAVGLIRTLNSLQ